LRWQSLFKNYRNRVKNEGSHLRSFSKEAMAESK
jgi:hypothetical protein